MADSPMSSDSEGSRPPRGRGQRRARGRLLQTGRGRAVRRGERGVHRGGVRGRGRGAANPNRADVAAAALQRKKRQIREIISAMSEVDVRELLAQTIEKQPSLLLVVLDRDTFTQGQPSHHPERPSSLPDWCVCTYCVDMPTPEERLCCGKLPNYCVSRLEDFQLLMLDEAVLALARAYREDVLAVPQDVDFNRGNQHASYRQFTLWQHGRLGAGIRRVIPSCCVHRIRIKYPDQYGHYTGFLPGRLG